MVVNGEKLNMTAVLWRVPLFAPTKDRETASPASEDVVAMANHIALSVHGVAGDAEYWRIRNIAEREIAALASPTPRDTLVEVLTDDCEFLLSVIDSCDEAEAPSCEMEPEDVARIATIRAAINASTVDFVRSRAALNSTQQPTRDHKKAPQGRCGKCLERLRNCTCFPQPDRETDREALLRLLLALQERRVKHIRTEYERGWNYGLEEAEDVIKRIAEGMKGHE
jgi:hypothetical protein